MSATAVQPDLPCTDPAATERSPDFSGLGDWVDEHPRFTLAVLFAIYICAHLGYSLRVPLWHDELFTYYIAQAPTVRELLHLTRTIDLNPPLSYLITRVTFHILGDNQ